MMTSLRLLGIYLRNLRLKVMYACSLLRDLKEESMLSVLSQVLGDKFAVAVPLCGGVMLIEDSLLSLSSSTSSPVCY